MILRLGLTGVVPEGHRVPWDVGHALLAKGVLVREKAGRWVPKSWRVSLGTSNIYDNVNRKSCKNENREFELLLVFPVEVLGVP